MRGMRASQIYSAAHPGCCEPRKYHNPYLAWDYSSKGNRCINNDVFALFVELVVIEEHITVGLADVGDGLNANKY